MMEKVVSSLTSMWRAGGALSAVHYGESFGSNGESNLNVKCGHLKCT